MIYICVAIVIMNLFKKFEKSTILNKMSKLNGFKNIETDK